MSAIATKIILNSPDFAFNLAAEKLLTAEEYSYIETYTTLAKPDKLLEAINDKNPWSG